MAMVGSFHRPFAVLAFFPERGLHVLPPAAL